jgi:hypothetical protein
MFRPLSASLAALIAATAAVDAHAQTLSYPVGVRVPNVFANNTNETMFVTPCPPWVLDANFQPIQFFQACALVALLLEPGASYATYWDQRDGSGQQVAPGQYYVDGVPVIVDASLLTALTPFGDPRVGASRAIELASPTTPGGLYVLAASTSTALGVPLGCGLTFPLDYDALFQLTLTNPGVFANFIGVLDGQGYSTAPRIAVPSQPSLAGIGFDLAFAVLDGAAPCGVAVVSQTVGVTVLP